MKVCTALKKVKSPVTSKQFTRVDSADLHRTRASQILRQYPEVRGLMGYDRWAALIILVIVPAQIFLGYWVSRPQVNGLALFALAALVGSVLNHWLAMGVHEASHNLILKRPASNRLLAIFANLPHVLPGAMSFFRHHLKHHQHLGNPLLDNDLPSAFEAKTVGNSPLRKFIWLLLYPLFGVFFRGFMVKPNRWEILNLGVAGIFTVGSILAWGPWPAFYWLLSTYIGFGLHPVAGHWIHEHYLWDGKQETTSYYGPLNWVTYNVGFHTEHHDLPNIPGRHLPKFHRIANDFYRTRHSDSSWSLIWLRFVFRQDLSHYSRIVRRPLTRVEPSHD